MIPATFEYDRPATLSDALALLERHGDEARVLAGGHSLLPAMKLRLAQPTRVIDLGGLDELRGVREEDQHLVIGAMTTHAAIAASPLLRTHCPLLPIVAAAIGDVQVRNRGTIGGSLAHADPAGDWPAAALVLEAELEIAGPTGRRHVKANEFFVDVLQTAVQSNEILVAIRVPKTDTAVAYVKFPQKASGFALAGVAVCINRASRTVRVAVTGLAPTPYRAVGAEARLNGSTFSDEEVKDAALHVADGIQPMADLHASAEYRRHLAGTALVRATARALSPGVVR